MNGPTREERCKERDGTRTRGSIAFYEIIKLVYLVFIFMPGRPLVISYSGQFLNEDLNFKSENCKLTNKVQGSDSQPKFRQQSSFYHR